MSDEAPSDSLPARPNVLVVLCDQMKATASRLYAATGTPTPALERLAESGVLFRTAFTPHPLCVPARASLWTGRYPHAHGSRDNETLLDEHAEHAFDTWRAAGYHLALIGKNHVFGAPRHRALFDTWCELDHEGLPERTSTRGLPWVVPTAVIDGAHAIRKAMPQQAAAVSYAVGDGPIEGYGSAVIAAQTERFLAEHGHEPFVAWVSFPDPHTPYEAPQRYVDAVVADGVDMPPQPDRAPDDAARPERFRVLERVLGVDDADEHDVRALWTTYLAQVRFVDDALGRILDAVERQGLSERTIVVFCSDHGDLTGEHRMTRKGGAFFDALVRVPLAIAWPGTLPAGVVDESLVNLVDLAPTLLRLTGCAPLAHTHGQPLPSVTDAPTREYAFAEYGAGGPHVTLAHLDALPVGRGTSAGQATLRAREAEGERRMVRGRRWKYVTDPTGDLDELFDLEADPWEHHDRAADPALRGVIEEHRQRLLAWAVATDDAGFLGAFRTQPSHSPQEAP
ncbi:MAG: sulfatase-like hydrolase/transferase [Trueperaceae bacterium]|nr:sulfatase-like hydrolase/transferase [Trueperaceae bacterium]